MSLSEPKEYFTNDFSREVWHTTYRDHKETNLSETYKRVSSAISSVESDEEKKKEYSQKFLDELLHFRFVPGGRIVANAGTQWKNVGLINCYTGGRPKYDCDSLTGILEVLHGQALTLKSEGGWGLNFSFIRPRGAFIYGVGVESPGPVKFMELFDKSSDVITSGSGGTSSTKKEKKGKIRKGAQMAILSCWHPSIFEYVTAKQTSGKLTKFNMSVYCTDEFMDKVIEAKAGNPDVTWDLVFPNTNHPKYKEDWDGDLTTWKSKGHDVIVYETIPVLKLWDVIIKSTYNRAEPGVLFLDKANKTYCFNYSGIRIQETNACCFAKSIEVPVITKNGIKEIKSITKDDLVWINSENKFVNTSGYFEAGSQDVYEVLFSNGKSLNITKNHKLCTPIDKRVGSKLVSSEGELVELKDLKIGDRVCVHDTFVEGVEFGKRGSYDEGLIMGWLSGDGHLTFGNVSDAYPRLRLDFWKNEHDAIQHFDNAFKNLGYQLETFSTSRESNEVKSFASTKFSKDFIYKYEYNIWNFKSESKRLSFLDNSSEEFLKGFIKAYFTADGTVTPKTSTTNAIQLSSINKERLIQIQSILNLYGIKSGIALMRAAGESEFKNCGKYQTKDCWRITITGHRSILNFYKHFGFLSSNKQNRLEEYSKYENLRTAASVTVIKSITHIGSEEVGCIEVPEYHKFTANGIISGNSEQVMPQFSSCNLLSMNLSVLFNKITKQLELDKLAESARIALRFADNVNDLTTVPLTEYENSVRNLRRVGIGMMGWGTLLYMLKIPFASKESEALKETIMKTICYSVIDESVNLAIEKGMFVGCEPEKHADCEYFNMIGLPEEIRARVRKYGVRNSSFFSIQPTGNTSIFANNISGGCEPIYMAEYIRTSIVQDCPAELLGLVPKYWEGEFFETDTFKFAKDGDEQILMAVVNGTTYRIDKSRGLTKDTLCEDYAVSYLKSIGEWDASADWAKTTNNLTVADHITDLKGFTKWLDASCSKTINIPNDYPFEKFEDVYLDAYKTGTIKGITTYRAGTMSSVLKSVDTKEETEVCRFTKRPKELKCDVYHCRVKAEEYFCLVGLDNCGNPYEVFAGRNGVISKSVESGVIYRQKRGHYQLYSNDEILLDNINKFLTDDGEALTRMTSMSLRHCPTSKLKYIVEQLGKVEGDFTNLSRVISRCLKKYIKDGDTSSIECSSCGQKTLVYSEGCKVCKSCGQSACG